MAYYQIEPFGQERDDIRMAYIVTKYLNTMRQSEEFKVSDFMPFHKEDQDISKKLRNALKRINK